jgi:pimeloyl-ACP methyl ester carboxylesterase
VIRGPTGKAQLDAQTTTVPGLKRQLVIDGAGHFIQQERPQQVTATVIEFLRAAV